MPLLAYKQRRRAAQTLSWTTCWRGFSIRRLYWAYSRCFIGI